MNRPGSHNCDRDPPDDLGAHSQFIQLLIQCFVWPVELRLQLSGYADEMCNCT